MSVCAANHVFNRLWVYLNYWRLLYRLSETRQLFCIMYTNGSLRLKVDCIHIVYALPTMLLKYINIILGGIPTRFNNSFLFLQSNLNKTTDASLDIQNRHVDEPLIVRGRTKFRNVKTNYRYR